MSTKKTLKAALVSSALFAATAPAMAQEESAATPPAIDPNAVYVTTQWGTITGAQLTVLAAGLGVAATALLDDGSTPSTPSTPNTSS